MRLSKLLRVSARRRRGFETQRELVSHFLVCDAVHPMRAIAIRPDGSGESDALRNLLLANVILEAGPGYYFLDTLNLERWRSEISARHSNIALAMVLATMAGVLAGQPESGGCASSAGQKRQTAGVLHLSSIDPDLHREFGRLRPCNACRVQRPEADAAKKSFHQSFRAPGQRR